MPVRNTATAFPPAAPRFLPPIAMLRRFALRVLSALLRLFTRPAPAGWRPSRREADLDTR